MSLQISNELIYRCSKRTLHIRKRTPYICKLSNYLRIYRAHLICRCNGVNKAICKFSPHPVNLHSIARDSSLTPRSIRQRALSTCKRALGICKRALSIRKKAHCNCTATHTATHTAAKEPWVFVKSFVYLQKSPVYPHQNPQYPQKSPDTVSAKKHWVSAKEPTATHTATRIATHTAANKPRVSAKEPCVSAKKPWESVLEP